MIDNFRYKLKKILPYNFNIFWCLDKGIDISYFHSLTENMMKELVPKIGVHVKLKANIDEWNKIVDGTNNQVTILVSKNSK